MRPAASLQRRRVVAWVVAEIERRIADRTRAAVSGAALASLGVPAFACTPDVFPDLLAVALTRGDVAGRPPVVGWSSWTPTPAPGCCTG